MKFDKILAAAAVAVAATSLPVGAKELKYASFTPPQHTVTAAVIDKMNDELSGATGGELTVRGYFGGELGAGPAEQYVRVLQGVADLSWGLPGYTSSQFPKTMIVEMPGAVPEGKTGYDLIWDNIDALKEEFPGTIPVALWTSEPNAFIMKDVAVHSPEDIAGLKIRVAGSTAAEVAAALGATPVQMPMTEVYNALQTGLIDGVISGVSTLSDFKLEEVATHITTGAPLGRLTFFTVLNQSTYDGLSDDEKAAMDAVIGRDLSKSAEDAWNATADEALSSAVDSGSVELIELSDDEAKAFADLVEPVSMSYAESIGGGDLLKSMMGE
ncbi:TRAP transporter substrate-binding protein [Pseudoruegeria sp. HB172150]|uniref:TRAP transporter substrate-binding protein n=1 Tax=Pseudoruegeria sp. HB172150 TaxID=2721164 RepID=UPI0015531115|nr:TRAP transporter substrate-binding protein [Pseudoruegeria sp. HB172150]